MPITAAMSKRRGDSQTKSLQGGKIPPWRRFICGLLAVASFWVTAAAYGDDAQKPGWLRVSGFGSLGAVYDRGPKYFQRDLTQPNTFEGDWSWKADSILGLQLDAALPYGVSATAQLAVKDRADNNIGESLDWAFLRYRPNQGWMLRAGRLGLDIYLLSDYRNVSFAYLWQRPPSEFYGPLVVTDFDGSDISYSRRMQGGTLRVKLFGGTSQPSVAYTLQDNLTLDFDPLWGANLAFESERWRAQAAFGRVRFKSEVAAAEALLTALRNPALASAWPQAAVLADQLSVKDRNLSFYSAGVAYDDGQWTIHSELGYLRSEWAALRSIVSAYISCGRRFDNITPYAMFAVARPTGNTVEVPAPPVSGDPAIDAAYSAARSYANSFQVDQHTLSLGARWDLRQDLAVKVQWDHSWIKAKGGSLWFTKPGRGGGGEATANLFSISVNFLF